MSGRHQPLNGADSYVPARVVAHYTAAPDCFGCSRDNPCSQACAACSCRWSGDPMSADEGCRDETCVCHDPNAIECTNCGGISTDIHPLDMGRPGVWEVCGVCIDKMDARYEEAVS